MYSSACKTHAIIVQLDEEAC